MKKVTVTLSIQKPDDASIPGIYKAVAVAAGRSPEGEFDCRYICVAQNIFEWYKDYMKSIGKEESIGMLWVFCGPKVKDTLPDDTVEYEDGFFCQAEEETRRDDGTERFVLVDDRDVPMLLKVGNYDDKFAAALEAANQAWQKTDDIWRDTVFPLLEAEGYRVEEVGFEHIQIS